MDTTTRRPHSFQRVSAPPQALRRGEHGRWLRWIFIIRRRETGEPPGQVSAQPATRQVRRFPVGDFNRNYAYGFATLRMTGPKQYKKKCFDPVFGRFQPYAVSVTNRLQCPSTDLSPSRRTRDIWPGGSIRGFAAADDENPEGNDCSPLRRACGRGAHPSKPSRRRVVVVWLEPRRVYINQAGNGQTGTDFIVNGGIP